MSEDKKKALAAALGQIERQFGKGAVMRMGDQARERIPSFSTGSLNLDIALGIGGLPKGRIVEIYGPESSGKTTLTLSVIAAAQQAGATCAFVDAEHALDTEYASKLGVNVDDLLVSQPDTGEQALEITDMLVRSNAVDVLIVDSVAALVPKAEIEGEMGDMHVGLQARLMSQALRKITGNIKHANCLVIFINQIRMKIGVMFGSPETTTGGNALKFYASVRLDIRRTGAVKNGDEVIGSETKVKVVKNKTAAPFKEALFQIIYGHGISKTGEIVDLAVSLGLVEKAGAWYSYQGNKIGQGKANTQKHLEENPHIMEELEKAIRQQKLGSADFIEGGSNATGFVPKSTVANLQAATPERRVITPSVTPQRTVEEPVASKPLYERAAAEPTQVRATEPEVKAPAVEVISVGEQSAAPKQPQEFADDFLKYRESYFDSPQQEPVRSVPAVEPEKPAAAVVAPKPQSTVVNNGNEPEWFQKAYEKAILVQQRAWVVYKGKGLVKGRMTALEHIEKNPSIKHEIIASLNGMGFAF